MFESLEFIGFRSLLKKEVLRFWKVKAQTITAPLMSAGLYLLVFGVSLGRVIDIKTHVSYLEFLIPGLVALSAFNNALQNSASSLMASKFHGDLQDLKYIPLSRHSIGMAYSIACVIRGLGVGLLVFLLSELMIYIDRGSLMTIASPGIFIFFLVSGCLIFGNLGIWIGFTARSFDHIATFSNFVILPLIYFGGVFYSLSSLPPFWRNVSLLNPLVYLINGIRIGVIGESEFELWRVFLVTIIFILLSLFFAHRSIKEGSYQRF